MLTTETKINTNTKIGRYRYAVAGLHFMQLLLGINWSLRITQFFCY